MAIKSVAINDKFYLIIAIESISLQEQNLTLSYKESTFAKRQNIKVRFSLKSKLNLYFDSNSRGTANV